MLNNNYSSTYRIIFGDTPNLVVVVGSGQSFQSIRVKLPASRVQLLAIILGQLGPERVNRDDEGTTIGLELDERLKNKQ